MSENKARIAISLDLLKPQSNPEKLPVKLFSWLLSSGRYIFVFVEALVLITFIARFKLDADLAAKKEAIEQQIPYIESLKPYETLIRETQLKLSTINSTRKDYMDPSITLQKIASQTPAGIKITGISIEKSISTAVIHITGQTQISSDLTSFTAGLKEDDYFSNVNLISVGLEEGTIKFTIDAAAKVRNPEGKTL